MGFGRLQEIRNATGPRLEPKTPTRNLSPPGTTSMKSDTAASDLIGVMALIAVFVTVAAMAGVTLLSYPPGDAAPAMIARMANEGGSVSIHHDGGDPLERGRFAILVEGVDRTDNFSLVDAGGTPSSEWTSWKTGETLVLLDTTLPETEKTRIQIVGEGVSRIGSDWLLHEIGGDTPTETTGPTPTVTVTSTPTETAEPTPTVTVTPTPVPPVANFTANVTEGNAPLAVQFTDQSTGNVTSWAWNFGDGNTSTVQHPSHTYAVAGTYTVSLNVSNAYGFSTETKTNYITVLAPPVANFTANITEGNAPLAVQFNDTSTGNVTAWFWAFGDGNTSTVQHPVHIYETPGNYTASLTASNAYGNDTRTREDYIRVTKSFVDFVIDENVFVYGNALQFGGGNVNGPGATVIITGGLDTADLNGGASIAVSEIYIDGDVVLDHGSAGLGSAEEPGAIYVNGDLTLWNGQRHIYGDVYVAGDFSLKDARIHGNVYVDGDLTLDWTPEIIGDARIYYTGTFTHPPTMSQTILDKCIHQATVPGFTMPGHEIPSTKPAEWYTSRGYVPGGELTSNMKVFADSYTSEGWKPTANNVIIIARTGDITITGMGGSGITGVFFAPNGKVTFSGAFLEGLVIARDGFDVESGGTKVTFKNVEEYISDPADYPF